MDIGRGVESARGGDVQLSRSHPSDGRQSILTATLAKEIAATPGLDDLVAASHVCSVPRIDTAQFERRIIASFTDHGATLTKASIEIVGAIKQQFDDINAVIARQGPENRQSLANRMKAIDLHALTKVVRTHPVSPSARRCFQFMSGPVRYSAATAVDSAIK